MACQTFQLICQDRRSKQHPCQKAATPGSLVPWLEEALEFAECPVPTNTVGELRLVLLDFDPALWHESNPEFYLQNLLQTLGIPLEAVVRDDVIQFNHYPGCHDGHQSRPFSSPGQLAYSVGCNTSGIAWTFNASSMATVGVIWVFDSEGVQELQSILNGAVAHDGLLTHPLLLAFLTARAIITSMQGWVTDQKGRVTKAQLDTGYHGYRVPFQDHESPPLDLTVYSAEICGLAANMACSEVCLIGLRELLQYIVKENSIMSEIQAVSSGVVTKASALYMEQQANFWLRKLTALLHETKSWQLRVSILIKGLFNLIAQRDQEQNRLMQMESAKIAQATMLLAQESKRDSTSMKAIAAVTMFFLPGTFMASLFAIPVFEWDSATGSLVDHRFWIYWAVTAPLTFVTIGVWALWNWQSGKSGWSSRRYLPKA